MRKIFLISVCFLFLVGSLFADLSDDLSYAGDAGHAAAFLYLPVGAKAMGVAGAYTGLGDDPTAVFYNPATLIKMDGDALSFSGTKLSLDRYRAAFAAAFRGETDTARKYAYAFSALYTTVTGVQGYDSGANATGELANFSFVGQFSYASSVSSFSWGATVKYVHDSLDDSSGSGAAVDLGCEASFLMLKLAFSARNIGFMRYDETYWLKPVFSGSLNLKLGFGAIILQLDKIAGLDAGPVFRVASEFTIFSTKASDEDKNLKGLMNKKYKELKDKDSKDDKDKKILPGPAPGNNNDTPLSMKGRIGLADGNIAGGFSIQWQMLELSYAISLDELDEGAGHHLTLNYRF